MDLDILNCDKFVTMSNLEEVSSSAMYSMKSSVPAENGLVSFEIFGHPNSTERKKTYAYIDLHGYFLHPHVYGELTQLYRGVDELINGSIYYYIKEGKLIKLKNGEEAPKGLPSGTGLGFLYKYWKDINFKPIPTDAPTTAVRKNLLHYLSRDEAWLSKVPVIPAFYRDVDMETKRKNDINIFYTKLIGNAQVIKSGSALFDMYGMSSSHKKIQDLLIELYAYFIDDILGGSRGFIHKHIMGKTTDYSARSVISMPRYLSNSVEEEEVSFSHLAIPLAMCIKIFAPFIHYGIKKILEGILSGGKFIYVQEENGKISRLELAPNVYDTISKENLERLIDLYDESKEHRFDKFTLPTVGGRMVPCLYLYNDEKGNNSDRIVFGTDPQVEGLILDKKIGTLNLTELFYMAAYNTVRDKCIYLTRFPIEDMHSISPFMMNIIPCIETEKRTIDGVTYPRFPKKMKSTTNLKHYFIDTIRYSPVFNAAYGADFDGDMLSVQSVFTEEANSAAKKYIYSKTNILNISNSTMRKFTDVCAQSVYFLTYRKTPQ